jgi:hypothetical protein
MLITRYTNARQLAKVISVNNDKYHFAGLLMRSSEINILYYEDTFKHLTYPSGKTYSVYQKVGELERKNIPFILLMDTKCEINKAGTFMTIINADCHKREMVDNCYCDTVSPLGPKATKSQLFNHIFADYVDLNAVKSEQENFHCFTLGAAQDDLITKDLVFLAISTKDGAIYNAGKGIGHRYDFDKIWLFDEKYDYNPKTVDLKLTSQEKYEEFCYFYENEGYVNGTVLGRYDVHELAKIVTKYPVLFADIVAKGWSRHSEAYNKYVWDNMDDFSIAAEEEDDEYQEYYDLADDAPKHTKMCFSCSSYVFEKEVTGIILEGKNVDICADCMTSGFGNYASA